MPKNQSQNQPLNQSLNLTQKGLTPTGMINPTSEKVEYDSLTDRLSIQRTEDVSSHLDHVRRERNDNPNGMSDSGNWRKIGSIPMSLAAQWLAEEGFDCLDPNNAKEVKRRLNEHDKLRTVDRML